MEVIPGHDPEEKADDCFLHVCGGDPEVLNQIDDDKKFSPRMWR